MKHNDVHSNSKCAYSLRLVLIRAFLAEYCYTIAALVFLCTLSLYAIQMQRLFEFLMFAVMVLQLELAYRQWWFEVGRREPKLEVLDVGVESGGSILKLLIRNVGKDFAYNVNIPFLTLSQNMYKRLAHIFLLLFLRPALFRHFINVLRSCVECEEAVSYEPFSLPPRGQHTFTVDLSNCIKNRLHYTVIFISVCREAPPHLYSQCDAFVEIGFFGKDVPIISRCSVEREPPGMLTRIPNMISDLVLVLRISKAKR